MNFKYRYVALISLFSSACGQATSQAQKPAEFELPLVATEFTKLGYVAQGGMAQRILAVESRSSSAVGLASFTSSCDCLTINASHVTVHPDQNVFINVLVDLATAPHFLGDLVIEVKGLDDSGHEVLAFEVEVTVLTKEALGKLSVLPERGEGGVSPPDPVPMNVPLIDSAQQR